MTSAPADQMTISALQPWFGGKRTLAPRIVEALGPHSVYWEPFCGSCAVLFAKPPCRQETVNDLHGDLVNLARVVQDEELCQRLHWRLRRTIPTETFFRESLAVIRGGPAPAAPCLDRAFHYFVQGWLGMSGVAGTSSLNSNFAKRYSAGGGAPATRFVGAVDSLPWWHERLRGVFVLSGCGLELCEKVYDEDGTVVYADPPYLVKGAKYLHDFTPEQHERLAAALCRFKKTRAVVSYYEHPDLDRLYPGWQKLDVATAKSVVNSGKRPKGRVEAPEVLLVNRPHTATGLFATEEP